MYDEVSGEHRGVIVPVMMKLMASAGGNCSGDDGFDIGTHRRKRRNSTNGRQVDVIQLDALTRKSSAAI